MIGKWGLIGFFVNSFFKGKVFFEKLLLFFFLGKNEGEQVLYLFLESLVFLGEVGDFLFF